MLEILCLGPPLPAAEVARLAGCGAGVVRDLAARGLVEERLVAAEPAAAAIPDWRDRGPELSADQRAAAGRLVGRVEAGGFHVTVLDGVTGSGKTETYFAAIAAALAAGRQVLVLLPEIALGAQWLQRFRDRFGAMPAEWHSELGQGDRRDTWRAAAAGRAPVVVGARSALFLPFAALGLIIVDEEHDPSYKQEDGVCYQARDMAVLRASLAGIPIILVSATPSLETVVNIARGRYERVGLPHRHAAAELPAFRLVDQRRERIERGRFLSPPLVSALTETLAAGEQALLFLNRRGYAPLTLCRACGHRFQCPNCTAWLVEHRFTGRLLCHHCGHAEPVPPLCPECLTAGALVQCGPGVERLGEEVAARFPTARTALMVSDLLPGPRAAAALAQAMVERRYDVLIGTQIVAKGHHFPMLTLVGVVDADLGLTGGDLRAAERTYQLLHQVGGRAGRAERKGRVMIQTFMPDQPVMKALASGDRDRFLEAEAEARRDAGLPPFGRLAALIVSAMDAEIGRFRRAGIGARRTSAARGRGARSGAGAARGIARPPSPAVSGQGRARGQFAGGGARVGLAGAPRRLGPAPNRYRPLQLPLTARRVIPSPSRVAAVRFAERNMLSQLPRAVLGPWWIAQLLTGAKSFERNPVIGSARLNRWGLHSARVSLAHRLAGARRRRLARLVSTADREAFDRDGFVVRPNFLPADAFAALVAEVKAYRGSPREITEGDTILRKLALDRRALARLPTLAEVLGGADWRGLVFYAGSRRDAPVVWVQSILRHACPGPPDPQTFLHADTFHPTVKAWLFLTDVAEDAGPFTYVPGSHRPTAERLAWERRMSLAAARSANAEIRQGSFRIDPAELGALGFPAPRVFAVPANTLIVADTFGFHARGPSTGASLRVEIWAYGRRSPFLPLAGLLPWTIAALGRRSVIGWRIGDVLERAGVKKHRWRARPGVSAFDPPAADLAGREASPQPADRKALVA